MYGLVPARKANLFVGKYYSLDRCPLMGTTLALRVFIEDSDYRLKCGPDIENWAGSSLAQF